MNELEISWGPLMKQAAFGVMGIRLRGLRANTGRISCLAQVSVASEMHIADLQAAAKTLQGQASDLMKQFVKFEEQSGMQTSISQQPDLNDILVVQTSYFLMVKSYGWTLSCPPGAEWGTWDRLKKFAKKSGYEAKEE